MDEQKERRANVGKSLELSLEGYFLTVLRVDSHISVDQNTKRRMSSVI